ncbi:HAMP domain-containing histidine kinase [Verticiella sediminum]|uniref:histidine kinase n=1 Tax=Verticiella sediminum TaxID=1247510 RepID=A0A556APL4_9BURK|nr:HAMP domain-containing sensor histidine kinase [Verticiella sediminum]TSH94827.1 HAMP domain-containing histidine kinase [Verticiella sediminum]
MAQSIERRIRRTVLGAVLLALLVTVMSVLIANEKLEQAILALDIQAERDFLLELAEADKPLVWNTATLQAFYVPAALVGETEIPALFQRYPFPFAGEVEQGDTTLIVTASEAEGGRLYLAKDISIFEYQEAVFHRFLLALCVGMIALAGLLAHITGRRLAAPLTRLTRDIEGTLPAPAMPRVSEQSGDQELRAIACSFNRFLEELESYVRREKSLLGMASHELRTPLAVIGGALDVIEQRNALSPADARALSRIRRAADEMGANVEAILTLTRRAAAAPAWEPLDLGRLVAGVLADLAPTIGEAPRLSLQVDEPVCVRADPMLVRMLVRNLVHNALQHTTSRVQVRVDASWLEVIDEGSGLPRAYRDFLVGAGEAEDLANLPGLGLFIVTLIAERLGWPLSAPQTETGGTVLRLTFAPERAAA